MTSLGGAVTGASNKGPTAFAAVSVLQGERLGLPQGLRVPAEYLDLMQRCWAAEPEHRFVRRAPLGWNPGKNVEVLSVCCLGS